MKVKKKKNTTRIPHTNKKKHIIQFGLAAILKITIFRKLDCLRLCIC